jgi:OOP family OmpA-OmpF porin
VKGVATGSEGERLPADTDGDKIRDDKDACPKDKGAADQDPKKNGCPTVRVTESEVIHPRAGAVRHRPRATIKKVSDELLDKVAKVLKEHPELTKLEIQGHTDNRGNARATRAVAERATP